MPLPLPSSDSGDADRTSALPAPPPPASGRPTGPAGQEACFRHPDRVAGRRCTRCGRPACADCLHQAAVGSNCTDCVKASKPDIKTRARHWQAGKPAIITSTLIAANLAMFLGLGLFYGLGEMLSRSGGRAHEIFALFGPALDQDPRITQFSNGSFVATSGNEWYRLITSGFLHYGVIHIAFNMYILFMLGNMLEPQLGRIKYLAIYFTSMLGGAAGALLLQPYGFTAGASGAVFGLLGAAAVGMWHQGINPFSTGVGRLLLINIAFTFLWPSVSIGGHLGGVVAGAVCAFVMMAPAYKGYPKWAAWATPAVIAVASVAAAFIAVP